MSASYTITLSRWTLLRLWPAAWRDAVREFGLPLWHPMALAALVVGAWTLLLGRAAR